MTPAGLGPIAVENPGCGKVEPQRTIAEGDPECRVVLYLNTIDKAERAPRRDRVRPFGT